MQDFVKNHLSMEIHPDMLNENVAALMLEVERGYKTATLYVKKSSENNLYLLVELENKIPTVEYLNKHMYEMLGRSEYSMCLEFLKNNGFDWNEGDKRLEIWLPAAINWVNKHPSGLEAVDFWNGA